MTSPTCRRCGSTLLLRDPTSDPDESERFQRALRAHARGTLVCTFEFAEDPVRSRAELLRDSCFATMIDRDTNLLADLLNAKPLKSLAHALAELP